MALVVHKHRRSRATCNKPGCTCKCRLQPWAGQSASRGRSPISCRSCRQGCPQQPRRQSQHCTHHHRQATGGRQRSGQRLRRRRRWMTWTLQTWWYAAFGCVPVCLAAKLPLRLACQGTRVQHACAWGSHASVSTHNPKALLRCSAGLWKPQLPAAAAGYRAGCAAGAGLLCAHAHRGR